MVKALTLVLASGSKTRAKLLKETGIAFEVCLPKFNEEKHKKNIAHLSPCEQATELACRKALSVSRKKPEALVLGADQVCDVGGEIVHKAGNFEKARTQLRAMSGRAHYLHTAACLYQGENLVWHHNESPALTMRVLKDEEIEKYLKREEPYHTCGSYMFEGFGKHLFSKVEGDYYSILGLPLVPLLAFLYERKWVSPSPGV